LISSYDSLQQETTVKSIRNNNNDFENFLAIMLVLCVNINPPIPLTLNDNRIASRRATRSKIM